MLSALEILLAVTNPKEMPETLDRALIAQLFPGLSESKDPRDQVRAATALEMVSEWRKGFTRIMGDGLKSIKEDSYKARDEIAKMAAKVEASELRVQDLQGELRAAKEGRGLYEDKARTELERKLANKDRLLEQTAATEQTLNETILSLQTELRGRAAMVQRLEFELSQAKASAASAAEQTRKEKESLDKLIAQARVSLGSARDDIDSRWGHDLAPFQQAIRDGIVLALTKLPPPVSS